jgi:twitching motility two-component system response regulator PilH
MLSRILLAEGDHSVQQIFEQILSGEQVETVCAGDGLAALCLLNETIPDVLIADIELPDKSGYDLCRYVREEPEFRSMPVVLLDSHFDSFNKSMASNVGADVYLSKPFEPGELIGIVRNLLESKKGTYNERSAQAVFSTSKQQLPLIEASNSAEPDIVYGTDEMPAARQSSNRQTRTTSLPDTVLPRTGKKYYFALCAVLSAAILTGIGLAILERPRPSNGSRESSATEPAKASSLAVEGQQFNTVLREEKPGKISEAATSPSAGTDTTNAVSGDEVAEAVQTSHPANIIGATTTPTITATPKSETTRGVSRQDSPAVAILKGSPDASNDQRETQLSRPRSISARRPNTLRSHLTRSGQEMKKAGAHFGSGAKHLGESGGQAAGWAGKKVGRGAKAVGRALKKIF